MSGTGAGSNFLGMADEDFLKQSEPDAAPVGSSTAAATPAPTPAPESPADPSQVEVEGETEAEAKARTEGDEPAEETKTTDEAKPAGTDGAAPGSKSTAAPEAQTGDKDKQQDPNQEKQTEPVADYKSLYEKLMAPFKANGKTVEIRTPEEAVQLMQMGANYTRKMQDLVPHRKLLVMLENNGLLDEGKLSFLIDLEKKNPEAIKKLIKDAGIDPVEIDTSVEPAYLAGNHRVTDEEATFHSALEDLKSSPTGLETLQVISTVWDKASKDVLWTSPEIMGIIRQQRENGIYDRIATEIDRQRTMGMIAPTVPFLHAYKTVGDQLVAANGFADLNQTQQTTSSPAFAPSPIATRTQAPKPTVANGDRASAASPTRPTATKAKPFVNPLAMSDDEFLKQMENRV